LSSKTFAQGLLSALFTDDKINYLRIFSFRITWKFCRVSLSGIYDRKLRPKTWKEFDRGISCWKTKEQFLQGIEKAKKHRWKKLAKERVKHLTNKEKKEFREIFK